MLSEALSFVREAIVGNWDGKPDFSTIAKPRDFDRMSYLSPARRMQVLMGDIACNFRVAKNTASVDVLSGKEVICQISPPGQELLLDQLTYIRSYADLRIDRVAEINAQSEDILSFFGAQHHLNGRHRSRTLELLSVTQDLTIQLEMVIKHHCWLPRPIELSPKVQPMLQTPDHSTFPSGHATEAFAIATVLNRLANGTSAVEGLRRKAMPFRLAHRIAVNRTIAGLHFPVDSAAGAMLGCAIGEALHALATGAPSTKFSYGPEGYNLDKTGDQVSQDFTLQGLQEHASKLPDAKAAAPAAPEGSIFAAFWKMASEEFGGAHVGEGI